MKTIGIKSVVSNFKGTIKKKRSSLGRKLVSYTAIIVIIAALIQTAISIGLFKYIIDRVIRNDANNSVNSAAVTINSYMGEYESLINTIAADEKVVKAVVDDNKALMSMSLRNYWENYGTIQYVYFKGLDRKMVTYPIISIDEQENTNEDLEIMKDLTEVYWSEAYQHATAHVWVVTLMSRVEYNGEFLGYVGIDIALDKLSDMVNKLKFGSTGEVLLVNNKGTIMTSKDKYLIGQEYPNKELKGRLMDDLEGDIQLNEDGKDIYAVFKELNKGGINLLAKIDQGEFKKEEDMFYMIVIASVALVLAISTAITLFVVNKLVKRIKRLKEDMSKIQQGDLTVRTDIASKDEIGELAEGFNNMTDSLKVILENTMNVSNIIKKQTGFIQASNSQTLQSSEEISKTIEEVANVTNNQSMEVDKVASENSKLSKSINDIAAGLKEAVVLCGNVHEVNKEGIETVDKLVITTDNTSEKTTSVLDNVQNIADSTRRIDMVLEAISDIANQTNLLSLNASIEAARAGEAGKGFSVVADAIRKLAEQSKDSTEDIKKIISDITGKTSAAVISMEETRLLAAEQIEAVKATEKAFNNISQSIEALITTINNINERNNSMVRKKDRIEGYMEALSSGMTEISASAEEITASAEEQVAMLQEVNELTDKFAIIAEELETHINRFKVK